MKKKRWLNSKKLDNLFVIDRNNFESFANIFLGKFKEMLKHSKSILFDLNVSLH